MPVANMIFSAENPHMCENLVAEMTGLICSIKLLSKKWCGVDARLSLAFHENWFLLTYGGQISWVTKSQVHLSNRRRKYGLIGHNCCYVFGLFI